MSEASTFSRRAHGALYQVYGTGPGQRLLDAAIGEEPAYLWMLDDDP